VIVETLVLLFVVIFFYYSLQLTERALDVTNVFAIPKKILYSCMPIAGAVMIVYSIRNIMVEMIGVIRPHHEG
jgi:TRAP-type C4-dicarboxylate transport system permease small subunit